MYARGVHIIVPTVGFQGSVVDLTCTGLCVTQCLLHVNRALLCLVRAYVERLCPTQCLVRAYKALL